MCEIYIYIYFFFTLADWWLICMNLYSNLKSHSYIFVQSAYIPHTVTLRGGTSCFSLKAGKVFTVYFE